MPESQIITDSQRQRNINMCLLIHFNGRQDNEPWCNFEQLYNARKFTAITYQTPLINMEMQILRYNLISTNHYIKFQKSCTSFRMHIKESKPWACSFLVDLDQFLLFFFQFRLPFLDCLVVCRVWSNIHSALNCLFYWLYLHSHEYVLERFRLYPGYCNRLQGFYKMSPNS